VRRGCGGEDREGLIRNPGDPISAPRSRPSRRDAFASLFTRKFQSPAAAGTFVSSGSAARRRPTQDEGCACAAPVGGGLHAQRPAFGALVAPTVLAPQGAFCAARGLEGRLQCAPRDGKFVASHRMTGIDVEAVTHGSRPADVAVRETGAPLTTAHGEFVATSHVGISRSCFVGCWPPRISECSPD
jgi:hypothetical protein